MKIFEMFFIKEEASKGHEFLSQGKLNNHIYLVFRGKCTVGINTEGEMGLAEKIKPG